ncbi:9259_t:CDS:1, partial [Scutellospora calospora]
HPESDLNTTYNKLKHSIAEADTNNNNHNESFILEKRKRKYLTKFKCDIFERLVEFDTLSQEEISKVLIEICTLSDTKPENWDTKRIQNIWLRKKLAKKKKVGNNVNIISSFM